MIRKRFILLLVLSVLLYFTEGCAKHKAKQIHDGIKHEIENDIYLYAEEAERTA